MTLYNEATGFAPWAGEAIAECRHPRCIETVWSAPELEAIGLWRDDMIAPAAPVPEGKMVTGRTVARIEGVVTFVNALADAPEPESDLSMAVPVTYAIAQLRIDAATGEISGIGVNSQLAGAVYLGIGKYWVFFTHALPDANYLAQAWDGLCRAFVLEADKTADSFIISVTDQAGEPSDAGTIGLRIERVI